MTEVAVDDFEYIAAVLAPVAECEMSFITWLLDAVNSRLTEIELLLGLPAQIDYYLGRAVTRDDMVYALRMYRTMTAVYAALVLIREKTPHDAITKESLEALWPTMWDRYSSLS